MREQRFSVVCYRRDWKLFEATWLYLYCSRQLSSTTGSELCGHTLSQRRSASLLGPGYFFSTVYKRDVLPNTLTQKEVICELRANKGEEVTHEEVPANGHTHTHTHTVFQCCCIYYTCLNVKSARCCEHTAKNLLFGCQSSLAQELCLHVAQEFPNRKKTRHQTV